MEDKLQGGAACFSNEAERTRALQEVATVAQQPTTDGRLVPPPNASLIKSLIKTIVDQIVDQIADDAPASIRRHGERCSKKGNGGKWQCKNTAMIDRKLCARCTETMKRRRLSASSRLPLAPAREVAAAEDELLANFGGAAAVLLLLAGK